MRTVTVTTPSRLHFGLMDLNGSIGRVDGSVGLAIESPRCVVEAVAADDVRVEGDESARGRVESVAARLRAEWGVGGARFRFIEAIPPHSGFGSGTQTTLAVIAALSGLYGVPLARGEAARLSGRGGASGIGVHAFFEGGFLVDGGHRYPEAKSAFLPSAASASAGVGPLLFRRDFPDWGVLLVVPNARHISGEEETRLFQTRCPVPRESAERVCHELVMGILPALAEENLPAFGRSLESLQSVGWKRIEIEAQDEAVRDAIAWLRCRGFAGVAMSSWGPVVVGFTDSGALLAEAASELIESSRFSGSVIVTRASNRGAEIAIEG